MRKIPMVAQNLVLKQPCIQRIILLKFQDKSVTVLQKNTKNLNFNFLKIRIIHKLGKIKVNEHALKKVSVHK